MLRYGFLFDRDVAKAASLFPASRCRTIADAGLPDNATDAEIVQKAWDLRLIIVTSNGVDFVREFRKFLSQTKRNDCHEMFGLVILPNGYENQKRSVARIEEKLRLGDEKVTWADVAGKDYCVRVKRGGNPDTTKFPRCLYCRKLGHA
jgi:hypothetical protein